jgi:nitroreductase
MIELIKARRSVRKYKPDKVPDDMLQKILEAASWSPSANNAQPWEFVVLKDEEVLKRVAGAATWGKFLASAPLGVVVVIDPKASSHPVEDGAIATYSMMLAAHSLGLGSCWIGAYDSDYEGEVKKALGIPEERRVLSILAIGYPAESPKRDRKSPEEIVFLNGYGKREKS